MRKGNKIKKCFLSQWFCGNNAKWEQGHGYFFSRNIQAITVRTWLICSLLVTSQMQELGALSWFQASSLGLVT